MKLDLSAIEKYAQQYASKVCEEFFSKNTNISGQQIMHLSNVGQVNVFIVKELFGKWKADTEKFKSPFFNFEHEDVKSALQSFMNVVSQHIQISRENFEPLLNNSVKKTIILLLDPSKYYDDFVRDSPDFILTKERLALLVKYTKINKGVAEALEKRIGKEEKVYVTEAISWLNEISGNIEFENPDKYLEMLSGKVPLDKQDFIKKVISVLPEPEVEKPALKMAQSFFDADPEELVDDEEAPLPTVAEVTAQIEKEGSPDIKLPNSLNDSFIDDLPTVNDLLKKEVISSNSTTDFGFNKPIKSIADAISLNQKFIFIGRLFDGDISSYNKSLEELDGCVNFNEAKNLMNKSLAPKYNWIMAAEEADEFLEIVSRKYQ